MVSFESLCEIPPVESFFDEPFKVERLDPVVRFETSPAGRCRRTSGESYRLKDKKKAGAVKGATRNA